jgi:micrococcal nuclease
MADTENFRQLKRAEPGLLPTLARNAARRKKNEGWTTLWLTLIAFVASGAIGSVLLGAVPISIPGLTPDAPPAAVRGLLVSFPICSGPMRTTCVVDGDTFWLEGLKYRVADIDTPEVSEPQCAAERALGRKATERFTNLLNAGPFELKAADSDEDRYGRKLRIVTRGGDSLGQVLVAEGLAHRWDGGKHSWC